MPGTIIYQANQAERLMAYCYYHKAEKVLRQMHARARAVGDRILADITAEAINEARRRSILGVFRSVQQIRSQKGAKA